MLVHPRIVIGVPSEITQVEKRAVKDSAYRAKASEVYLVEEAMAAANDVRYGLAASIFTTGRFTSRRKRSTFCSCSSTIGIARCRRATS